MAGTWNPINLSVTSAGLTTASTAYAIGDQLGTEITLATGAGNAGKGVFYAVSLTDYAKITGAVELRLFGAATTPAADNAAASWSDADADKILAGGRLDLPAPVVDANNSLAVIQGLWVPFTADASGNIYADLITRAGHTFFGAASDLRLKIGGGYWN